MQDLPKYTTAIKMTVTGNITLFLVISKKQNVTKSNWKHNLIYAGHQLMFIKLLAKQYVSIRLELDLMIDDCSSKQKNKGKDKCLWHIYKRSAWVEYVMLIYQKLSMTSINLRWINIINTLIRQPIWHKSKQLSPQFRGVTLPVFHSKGKIIPTE